MVNYWRARRGVPFAIGRSDLLKMLDSFTQLSKALSSVIATKIEP
jgi:hypothetical protein